MECDTEFKDIIPEAVVISDEDLKDLPRVSSGLLFVICGEAERALSLSRIVQVIPVDDNVQSVILYDMETDDGRFATQVVQHSISEIRKALS